MLLNKPVERSLFGLRVSRPPDRDLSCLMCVCVCVCGAQVRSHTTIPQSLDFRFIFGDILWQFPAFCICHHIRWSLRKWRHINLKKKRHMEQKLHKFIYLLCTEIREENRGKKMFNV